MNPAFTFAENSASVWRTTCTSQKAEQNCSLRKARLWRTRSGRSRTQAQLGLTPPPTPACGAIVRQGLPLPAPPARPDIGGNRCGRQLRAGPASCLLFGECAAERVRDGLL